MPSSSQWNAGSSDPALPDSTSVTVEPSAIPGLVSALQSSLDSLGVQIEHAITELRIRPWAGDPVSATTAERFNDRSVGGPEAALTALYDYRDQLQSAAEALELADERYTDVEDTNAARLNREY
ncbi:hypothetical protein FHX42_004269 [Saccharopolyspora lacisalsi]|uniref:PE family protein n=1 Tax=Halosaccharopolyspora lacisalsi TaxID=1000566 RepID=A0A839E1C6_9PSEU|nr:hypothetical protein [Halosaccharopolyspora lacisalsi]MBA8826890.1 hypothetical protein [Halosaccharopolyspora lacisalsi]